MQSNTPEETRAKTMLLLGDEAVGQAALDAGITTANGYPGTPSTEIFEYIQRCADAGIHATWAANEKVAYEQAMGASVCGRRTIVTMKHVGLNVAADAFVNSAVTGVNGGLVLIVADDPGMHSSQNEQDSRHLADFALVPCYEPATQQECYDMTREAFEASERFGEPVVVRLVTRLAHSRADVVPAPARPQNPLKPSDDRARFALLPSNARVLYDGLVAKQAQFAEASELSPFNVLHLDQERRRLGVIASGVAYNYLREVVGPELPSFLKVGLYPLPLKKIQALAAHCDQVLILEEGYPFIEDKLLGLLGKAETAKFRGRFSGHVPRTGELTPDIVARILSGEPARPPVPKLEIVRPRPPQLCAGCPHGDTYDVVNVIRREFPATKVFADIGCYTLGFYEPYASIDTCLDMGASISMGKGAADAGLHPVLCVIGDSTFGHSGMTGLLTAAQENTNMVVLILDNATVAMTGTQESLSHGDPLIKLVQGLGVAPEHIRLISPLPKHHEENVRILREEVAHPGLSVLIAQRRCVQVR